MSGRRGWGVGSGGVGEGVSERAGGGWRLPIQNIKLHTLLPNYLSNSTKIAKQRITKEIGEQNGGYKNDTRGYRSCSAIRLRYKTMGACKTDFGDTIAIQQRYTGIDFVSRYYPATIAIRLRHRTIRSRKENACTIPYRRSKHQPGTKIQNIVRLQE